MGVHGNIDAGYGAVNLGTIFELNGHRFMAQFHQKSEKKIDILKFSQPERRFEFWR